MMAAGKPEQGAPKSGAERPQDDKSKYPGAGPESGYEHGGPGPQGWGSGPGMPPPWMWGMQPGMGGPFDMYAGRPPGMPPGAGHHHRPWEPYQPPNFAPSWPWAWWSWFMPWLGPWWSWLSSWFIWPGFSWMMPPFSPFPPPYYPTGQAGSGSDQTMRFAETRAAFYRHWFEAQAAIFHQAANASHVPGAGPAPSPTHVDIGQLRDALTGLPEQQAALVIHAVQVLQAWDGMRSQQRAGSDW